MQMDDRWARGQETHADCVAGYILSGACIVLAIVLSIVMRDVNAAIFDCLFLFGVAGAVTGWCLRADPRFWGDGR